MDHFKDIYEAASLNDENRLRKLLEIENDDLEDLLSRVCMELQLNCVPLADGTKLVLDRKLLNLRSFNRPSTSRLTTQEISDRLGFTLRLIHNLHTYEGNDELFIFNLVCIAKQICILKKILKSTYDRLPWEEIEFCILTYIRSFKEQNEIVIFSKAILSKLNISSYLRMFANHLEKLQEYVLTVKLQELVKFPNLKRTEAVDGIMANFPEFESLYNDHERLRDIHSLNIMLNSVQLVESIELEIALIDYVDSEEKHSILVLLRALHVIAAHLKNTLDSPKLSQLTISYLLTFFNRNTREILIELRDRLSCNQFPPNGEELLQSQDIEYLMGIKNDIEKIGKKIGYILLKYKLQLFSELAEKLYLTNDAQVFEEVVELMFKLDIPTLLEENICELNENNELKDLIIQLQSKISPKSSYSEFTFGTILEECPEKLTIDYMKAITCLRVQCEKMYKPLQASCYYSLDTMKLFSVTSKCYMEGTTFVSWNTHSVAVVFKI